MRKNNWGREYELQVCNYLEQCGMIILERNFTINGGEADIIAQDGDFVCFVEVKFRSDRAVDAYRSVGFKKQRRIIKSAEKYLYKNDCRLQPRFDVVFIFSDGEDLSLEYIKNAFDASERIF